MRVYARVCVCGLKAVVYVVCVYVCVARVVSESVVYDFCIYRNAKRTHASTHTRARKIDA